MADLYLPIAQAAFGRTSKSRPHRLHHAHRATYEAFADPDAGDVLLELRAEGKAKRRRPKKPAAAPQDSGAERSDPPKAGAHQPRPLHSSCPVVALGMSGSSRRYLDAKGQLIELPVSRRVKAEIQGLFCDQAGLALEYWTRINDRTGRPDGWHPERATLDLLTAAARTRHWAKTM
ncbi:MAG: hypothetical protein JO212_12830 [Acetobacteraceae bacterium]|nr:hypothetical protein [Acetobacteraceae bacterium]